MRDETGHVLHVGRHAAGIGSAAFGSAVSSPGSPGGSLCLGVRFSGSLDDMACVERVERFERLGTRALFLGSNKHRSFMQLYTSCNENDRAFSGVQVTFGLAWWVLNRGETVARLLRSLSQRFLRRVGEIYTTSAARITGIADATSPGTWQGGERL